MSKFDTHGGYFAPDNYIRINEGGSHEENPNGGVQMGVDPQGIPNMVEEDETVYDDYVFSDNITVDEEMQEKHNLPKWSVGKLYSKVVDRLVDEASERGNDVISNNGLEVMLGRVRDAQEEQKMLQQQRELEEELASLSPEELDELEALLSQEEAQPQQVPQEVLQAAPMEQMPEGEVAGPSEPMPIPGQEQMPVMANGGYINTFDGGGFREKLKKARAMSRIERQNIKYRSPHERRIMLAAAKERDAKERQASGLKLLSEYNDFVAKRDSLLRDYNAAKAATSLAEQKQYDAIMNNGDFDSATKEFDAANAEEKRLKWLIKDFDKDLRSKRWTLGQYGINVDATPVVVQQEIPVDNNVQVDTVAIDGLNFDDEPNVLFGSQQTQTQPTTTNDRRTYDPLADGKLYNNGGKINTFVQGGHVPPYEGEVGMMWLPEESGFVVPIPYTTSGYLEENMPALVEEVVGQDQVDIPSIPELLPVDLSDEALGITGVSPSEFTKLDSRITSPALISRRREGSSNPWEDFLKRLGEYSVSRNPGGAKGTYRIDNNFPLGNFENIKALEDSAEYQAFTNYVLDHPDDPYVQRYLQALDAGTADKDSQGNPIDKLFIDGKLRDKWQDLYKARRRDQNGGIYHFSGDDINLLRRLTGNQFNLEAPAPIQAARDLMMQRVPDANEIPGDRYPTYPEFDPSMVKQINGRSDVLSTFPQYAGALTAGALGLYNLAQQPDRYVLPRINPVLPQGRMNLIDPVYNPIDQEQVVNSVLASGAGTNRGIINAGLGPSTAATLLASDYNTGRNIGTAREQVSAANDQQLNSVIAGRNNNASTLGQFDYGQSRDRASILNDFAARDLQNSIMRQRLNYMSEGEKYGAIQQSLDTVAQALSGIGRQNVAMNMANNNGAFYNVMSPNGMIAVKPSEWLSEEDKKDEKNKKNGGKIKRRK